MSGDAEKTPGTDVAAAAVPAAANQAELVAHAREAMQQKRWEQALARWDACIASFGPRPHWLSQKAIALRRLTRLDEADALYQTLAREHPALSAGLDGLAWNAFRRNDFPRALALFTRCVELYPDKSVRTWNRQRANLLLRLGRADEAQALYRELVEEDPEDVENRLGHARAAIESCRSAPDSDARRKALAREVVETVVPKAPRAGLQLLVALGAVKEAGEALLRVEREARTLEEIETCFLFTGRLLERGARGAVWERLLVRAREIGGASDLELRLLLALEQFGEFVHAFDARRGAGASPHRLLLERVRDRLAKPRSEVFQEAKVFGIGLSRTGTTSLSVALTALGIDTVHWTNPLTHQLLSGVDFFMFGASTDCCVSGEFEKLYYQYPNARFVWTTRPLESWLASFREHHAIDSWTDDAEKLRRVFSAPECLHMFAHAALEFELYLNVDDLARAWRSFDERVRHFFANKPKAKLLEFDLFAGQGWPELCGFLGLAVPAEPFPRLNAAP
jgi:tetratricopeptide (TPR) repeat protein